MNGGAEGARAHAVDADAVTGVFDGRDLRQLNHRRLGGAIGSGVRPRGQTGDRCGQDDGARVLRTHDAHGGAYAVHGAEDIDPEGPLPVLGAQIVDPAVGGEDPRIGDQDV